MMLGSALDFARRRAIREIAPRNVESGRPGVTARQPNVTPRQQQILGLMLEGKRNKEIAALIGLTEGTVKVYISNMYRTLGIKSRAEAVKYVNRAIPAALRARDQIGTAAKEGAD